MKTLGLGACVETVENVDYFLKGLVFLQKMQSFLSTEKRKISTTLMHPFAPKIVDIVDNYFPRMLSPIFRTSPAPIVINKSPLIQFCNKKFSISSKEGK